MATKSLMAGAALLLLGSPISNAPAKTVRSVQLISMAGDPRQATPAQATADEGEHVSTQGRDLNPASGDTDGFRAHDLSRKYVEFQMAQVLSTAGQNEPTPPLAEASLSPAHLIPAWMQSRAFSALPPTTFATGCGISAYRPTGFLKPVAEMRRAQLFETMSDVACEYGIPVGLFDAMIIRESGYQAHALSPKSAYGLTQLMAGTAAQMGVNRYDPMDNLRGGARYLRSQLDRFGQFHLALAAYNAGPERIRNGAMPAIVETQAYVADILQNWRKLTSTFEPAIAPLPRALPSRLPARPTIKSGPATTGTRIASISRF